MLLDLSFARSGIAEVTALPTELAVLMVGVASRQAASTTARVQAQTAPVEAAEAPLAPASGAFHALTATALTRRQEG